MSRLIVPMTATALLLSTAATAEVTTAEVWANSIAPLEALGAKVTASPTTEGATTVYRDYVANFVLPFGAGTVTLGLPTSALTDNGDGTVTMSFPEGYDIAVAGTITGETSFSAVLEGTVGDTTILASGTPGDVTYLSNSGILDLVLTDMTVDGMPFAGFNMALTAEAAGATSEMRITQGDLVTMTLVTSADSSSIDLAYAVDGIETGTSSSTTTATRSTFELAMPAGGADILNLSAALRDGMAIYASNAVDEAVTASVIKDSLSVILSQQNTRQRDTGFELSFDSAGLAMSGTAEGFVAGIRDQFLPFPISGEINSVVFDFQVPLLASDQPQSVVLNTTLGGVTLADDLWNLFDPDGALDRAPLTYRVDISGDAVLTTDLLDVAALTALGNDGMPGDLPVLTLDALLLEGLGAVVSADGTLALDWSTMPFMGSPMPTSGSLDFRTEGLTAAMGSLVQAGLLTAADTMPVTIGIGMIGRPVGEDTYEGTIELTEEGQILANGLPLQ